MVKTIKVGNVNKTVHMDIVTVIQYRLIKQLLKHNKK